jgi:amidase
MDDRKCRSKMDEQATRMTRRGFLSAAGSAGLVGAMTNKFELSSQDASGPPSSRTEAGLCFADAVDLSTMIRASKVSSTEVMTAFLSQIKRVNPSVNAICTLIGEEQAMRAARDADERLAKGQYAGPLHGLPLAVKDLALTAGIRTTYGSRIYKDFVPAQDALFVERLKAAGAILIGKTNAPEFGAGSQTFNEVFGATLNPYDPAKTCGGSSGGAAVALACGMVPLADGSDFGGSLRNPASFCNVVGFRPSPGRVPTWPAQLGWSTLSVEGPMARSVQDLAFLLSIMAGPDSRAPISIAEPGWMFSRPLSRDFRGVRIAWSRNLGRYQVEPAVTETTGRARPYFEQIGCRVDEAEPDFKDADDTFQILRAWNYAVSREDDLKRHRHLMKDTVIWNIEQGLKLSGLEVSRAEARRTLLYHRVREFLERYEFLVLPVCQVVPFSVKTDWVREINGVKMESYIDWMATCYAITLTGLPAISVPCGFTPEGLPVGLQIVGRHRSDFEVLQLAYAFEQVTRFGRTRPRLAV